MQVKHGNLLEVQQGILVHGCNAVGGFGSGIAGQIAKKWPGVAHGYKAWFEQNPGRDRMLGSIQVFVGRAVESRLGGESAKRVFRSFDAKTLPELPPDIVVVNAITQFYYGRDSRVQYVNYDAVNASMSAVAMLAKLLNLTVHYPAIGAGLANGNWDEISKRIAFTLDNVDQVHWVFP